MVLRQTLLHRHDAHGRRFKASEHICGMAQKHETPQLNPREYKDGRGWYVEATSDGSVAENVGDFGSAPEAQEWIARKSAAYFKARLK
jgi:hypothetical protein